MTDDASDADTTSRTDALDAVRADEGARTAARRSVLRGAVAGVAASLGLSGTAAALDPAGQHALRRVRTRYDDVAARRVFRERGSEVLDLLAERGHVADADALADDLVVDGINAMGTPTARIEATREFEDGALVVAVEPEADRAYAIVDADGERTILDPSVEENEVDTSACLRGTACLSSDVCDSNCQDREVECCENDCFLGLSSGCCSGTCYSDCSFVCI